MAELIQMVLRIPYNIWKWITEYDIDIYLSTVLTFSKNPSMFGYYGAHKHHFFDGSQILRFGPTRNRYTKIPIEEISKWEEMGKEYPQLSVGELIRKCGEKKTNFAIYKTFCYEENDEWTIGRKFEGGFEKCFDSRGKFRYFVPSD